MKKLIIQTEQFKKDLKSFLKKRSLLEEDFETFKKEIVQNPQLGPVITGTGGVRKIRLKSSSGGKSGGFRICYVDIPERERLYLLFIYPKNIQENLTAEEKKILKKLVSMLKENIK